MVGGSFTSVIVIRIDVDTVLFGDPSSVADRTRSYRPSVTGSSWSTALLLARVIVPVRASMAKVVPTLPLVIA
jgi:hypothetical protein